MERRKSGREGYIEDRGRELLRNERQSLAVVNRKPSYRRETLSVSLSKRRRHQPWSSLVADRNVPLLWRSSGRLYRWSRRGLVRLWSVASTTERLDNGQDSSVFPDDSGLVRIRFVVELSESSPEQQKQFRSGWRAKGNQGRGNPPWIESTTDESVRSTPPMRT